MPATTNVSVSEVMTREPVCVDAASSIREVARLLEENEISGAPVVRADGRLIGVVSKTDLLRRCAEGSDEHGADVLLDMISDSYDDAPMSPSTPEVFVEDFMSTDPVTASREDPIVSVAKKMAEARVHRVVVVDDQQAPVGIVTSLDMIKLLST